MAIELLHDFAEDWLIDKPQVVQCFRRHMTIADPSSTKLLAFGGLSSLVGKITTVHHQRYRHDCFIPNMSSAIRTNYLQRRLTIIIFALLSRVALLTLSHRFLS